jgi:hypothetical protein
MRKFRKAIFAMSCAGALAACQDLTVLDENAADNERALREPDGVEQVIKSAFQIYFVYMHRFGTDVQHWYPLIADEMTYSAQTSNGVIPSAEPRVALRNDPVGSQQYFARASWDDLQSSAANARDALQRMRGLNSKGEPFRIITLDDGATTTSDNTDRAYAYAKIQWGISMGYMGLIHDQAALVTVDDSIPSGYDEQIAFEKARIKPYQEVVAAGIKSIEEGIAYIESHDPFTLPATWVTGSIYTSAQFVQYANTMIARMLVYTPRTPEERAQVNWQKVLDHTAKGLTVVWGPTLSSAYISSYYRRLQGASSDNGLRADNRLIGPADVSGNYQAWLAQPLEQRTRFLITTPDRRILSATPAGVPTRGAYFRPKSVTDNVGFNLDRGTYHLSNYQWYRNNGSNTTGQAILASPDENRLYRAEAFYRMGNLQEAANLINVTRTRSVTVPGTAAQGGGTFPGLPAITTAGVPQSPTCVPKTATGACGSLLDALKYERQIELAGLDPLRPWLDYRGFGQLVTGTMIHMPIPARYQIRLDMTLYTFGGGGVGSAQ